MPAAAPLQVAPGVHRVSVPLPFPPHEVAAWLLEDDEGHTLVDTGIDTPPARGALRDGAERLGVTPASLRHVVLTHAHIDHYGLAGPVRAWSGARVCMHEREEALIRAFVDDWPAERERAAEEFRPHGVPAEVVPELIATTDRIHAQYEDFRPDDLLAGERGGLPGGGGWEWMLTPGHSPGHVSVYHPGRRILIAGDHVLPRISPNIGADRYVRDPLSEYLTSLARLRDLPVDLVLPSHGEPFADLAARVDDLIAHHHERNARLLALLKRPRSAWELALLLFPDVPADTRLHALRETLAHLAYLERAARVVREGERGALTPARYTRCQTVHKGDPMEDWRSNLLESSDDIAQLWRETRRIAVLGIKTEAQSGQPAFYVPEYLKRAGFDIVPVPVYYPDATEILGQPVYRKVAEVPGEIDMVNVFRRSQDVGPHVDDILAARPKSVWMQSGIRNEEAARRFAEAGIRVVQDRCAMVEHRRSAR